MVYEKWAKKEANVIYYFFDDKHFYQNTIEYPEVPVCKTVDNIDKND